MFGLGLLKGLSVTMRHFIASYVYDRKPWEPRYSEEWLEKHQDVDGKGIFTIQYPEQKRKITEHFRFLPMLVYEESTDEPRCTACGICARVCPPQCIWIERATDEKGRPKAQPAGFWIDAVICMSCGYCTEYCPFDAIKMNQQHEIPNTDRDKEMFYDLDMLLQPIEYYAELHPSDYEREEEARRQKAEAKRLAAEKRKAAAAAKKEAAAKKAAKEAAARAESAEPDDLEKLVGIGAKESAALHEAGIKTYAQLSATKPDQLQEILEKAAPEALEGADLKSWSTQARLADGGKWDALERYQARLKG
jgi:NADH-quinone oxidoreductase subunit I